jgi:hypothetical protein
MRQTRKSDCSQFKPGELVKGAELVNQDKNGNELPGVRVGIVLPIDKKQAQEAFDADIKIGKFCATSRAYQYIYVDFTKKLNPLMQPYGIGKSWTNVRDLKLVSRNTNKTRKARK